MALRSMTEGKSPGPDRLPAEFYKQYESAVRSAAKLFVSICESQAPFVAVENPKMHSLATDLVGGRKPSMFNLTSTEQATRKPLACT
eukprot:scaffold2107_cov127-Isochrysis_galbana.AAC.7